MKPSTYTSWLPNPNLIPDYAPTDIKVGQIWKCIENENILLISMVKPEIRGYMFDGFQVVPYISLAPYDFCKYWKMIRERPNGS